MPKRPPEDSGMSNERVEILRMVGARTISVDDGARLLEALDRADRTRPTAPTPAPRKFAQNIRIRITDQHASQPEVDLVLPLGLVDAGLRIARRFAPTQVPDLAAITDAIDHGFEGHLLNIQQDKGHIEIIVESRK